MLLRFRAKNFLSLRDAEELSLVASTAIDDDPSGLIDCPAIRGSVLPSAVIYGANASGKTNLVKALRFMCAAVMSSHSRWDPNGGVPRTPFALDPDLQSSPSEFDIDFVLDGTRYHYGFVTSDDAITEEWLHAFPNGRRQVLFERSGQKFEFGRNLRGRNKLIEDLTRGNSLYLSVAAQSNHDSLLRIFTYFLFIIEYCFFSISGSHINELISSSGLDPRAIRFLESTGAGIDGYATEDRSGRRSGFHQMRLWFDDRIHLDRNHVLKLGHTSRDGRRVYFDLDFESEGTRRLLVLMDSVYRALDTGTPLVVDELNASLHTLACEEILRLFNSPETNPKGAQLIATTHDTNLLRSAHLRRDQVWFAEKDGEGATHVYPLTDIRTRKGDNLEKGYLQGRYGAVPFSGPLPRA